LMTAHSFLINRVWRFTTYHKKIINNKEKKLFIDY
jgi:hypothetical protein